MSIPLKHWYRLGKKIFLLYLLRSGWFFILLFGFLCWFTYKVLWSTWKEPFKQFFIDRPNWYVDSGFVLEMMWLTLLGYLIIVILRGWVIYRQYKFMLDEHAFYVRRGIFFIREAVIPYHHIQNVEIRQPYLYRFVGLAELDITTLSGSGNIVITDGKKPEKLLPVIDRKMAKALAHELVHRGSTKDVPFLNETEDDPNQLTEVR